MALATAPPQAAPVTAAAASAAPIQAEPDEELFDIYDDQCNLLGQERRAVVHAKGLLHKAVYCFVFNNEGQLLIQRRSRKKKIGPGQWDLSVAEHLSPGTCTLICDRLASGLQLLCSFDVSTPFGNVIDIHGCRHF